MSNTVHIYTVTEPCAVRLKPVWPLSEYAVALCQQANQTLALYR